ncbi:DUF2889 domain-containing protein [Novosphingobium panipatense]|uniref:DUF2889 family protein n=1 Tax=Novosphingobium panipatense TaxID=428991 RepID=A0ABY1Q1P4_9SPHN|nr:DUF2889 domain-containing protein [Novosphingobium panipatense]SMP56571.1 Protein of unknown function [Novosphingobium panipatense]
MIAIAIEDVFALPGYRRTIRIEPGEGRVRAMLEDDLHAMAVQLWHARGVVTNVVPVMDRAPWTPCPGAQRVLIDTFTGLPLHQVSARFERQANCTHLHDLAVLAAAHAGDASPTEYRIAVTDLLEGERLLEIRHEGQTIHQWREREGVLAAPTELAGLSLLTLRDWIARLQGRPQEAARLLQWAGLVGHSRAMGMEERHAALLQRPSCYTMQPEHAVHAAPLAPDIDFSVGDREPLMDRNRRFGALSQQS